MLIRAHLMCEGHVEGDQYPEHMLKVMFDSMIWDHFLQTESDLALLRSRWRSGELVLFTTDLQRNQNAKIVDPEKRLGIDVLRQEFGETCIPTSSFVLDLSGLGNGKLAGDHDVQSLQRLVGSKRQTTGNLTDALIATTAMEDNLILVTQDKRLRASATRLEITSWSLEDFLKRLEAVQLLD